MNTKCGKGEEAKAVKKFIIRFVPIIRSVYVTG